MYDTSRMREVKFGYVFWIMALVLLMGTYTTYSFMSGLSIKDLLIISEVKKDDNSMLFVGDVMLSRYVEKLMEDRGFNYPYRSTKDLLASYRYVIGNLEGTAPKPHIPTPEFSFQFSIQEDALEAAAEAGFTLLTQANNHTFDYGEEGYQNTKRLLERYSVFSAGHPLRSSAEDVVFINIKRKRIAIISINAALGLNDEVYIQDILNAVSEKSDLQFITIHWGEEYQLVSNESQQKLARALIDGGADTVIGHHPHVVQEVEMYKGVPIFYSLGNFIFDQYWNDEVQTGLAVGISFEGDEPTYRLIPLESAKSKPQIMSGKKREIFLKSLAERSDDRLAESIFSGSLTLENDELATSEKTVMIDTNK